MQGVEGTPGFHPDRVVRKEAHIVGAIGVDTSAYRAALALLGDGGSALGDVARTVAPLSAVEELIRSMARRNVDSAPIHGVVVP
jgi:alcohol dehydrogenase